MILFDKNECIDICLKNDNEYVIKAVKDLADDFKKISEYCVFPEIKDTETPKCIVIEKNSKLTTDPVSDETFTIKTEGEKIIISAPTYLGTMWGIYTFSEKILGVDPCYLFNDLAIAKKERLETEDINIEDKPEGFSFRGIFINDEDLLTGFRDGGGIRHLDFIYYGLTVEKSVMEKVVETALRLKLNLIIPASFLDIDNPPEKALADAVAERGIYVSQHHVEPLGLSSYTFGNYCKKNKKSGEFSYITNPEIMEEAWRFYAKKWAQYDNVVWQIGLRGKSDRPVWQEDTPTEEELKKYGQFISSAYKKQKEIVIDATDGRAKHFTSTLWMEGSTLAEKGLLTIPCDTVAVFADTGPNQMYGPEFYNVPRQKGKKYGIYYHLQYFCCGPHLAPQTGIDKLYYNIKLAKDAGDDSYSIINISNVREFTFELSAYSQMMWNTSKFSKEEYIDKYCKKYGKNKTKAKKLISDYFGKLPEIDVKHLLKHHEQYFNYSLKKAPKGIKNFVLKEGNILEHGQIIIDSFHRDLGDQLCREFYEAIKPVIPEYEKICDSFYELSKSADDPLKKHTEVKWLLYAKTLLCIYKWYTNLYEAKMYCDLYKSEEMKKSLSHACESLKEYLDLRKCAEYGYFANWYRGDLKMNIKHKFYDTKRLLGQTPDF